MATCGSCWAPPAGHGSDISTRYCKKTCLRCGRDSQHLWSHKCDIAALEELWMWHLQQALQIRPSMLALAKTCHRPECLALLAVRSALPYTKLWPVQKTINDLIVSLVHSATSDCNGYGSNFGLIKLLSFVSLDVSMMQGQISTLDCRDCCQLFACISSWFNAICGMKIGA